jgi:hypothetical protein
MRKTLFALGLFASFSGMAQHSPSGLADVPFTGNPLQSTYMTNLISQPLKVFERNGVSGSPYHSEEFKAGVVKLKNGYTEKNVPVRFNIFNNEMEFKMNGKELVLDSMDLVIYLDKAWDSTSVKMFKAGYPAVGDNKETTIYEVIVMGSKAHLIKRTIQRIEDEKTMGYADKKVLNTYTSLYLYNPETKAMVKLKDKKVEEQLSATFPALAQVMDKIVKEKKLNLKKEAELGELLTDYNNLQEAKKGF